MKVGAVDQAHVHEQQPVDLAVIVDRHHVGFLQTPGGVCLSLHALAKDRILRQRLGQQLQRDDAFLDGVFCLVYLAEAAGPDQPFQVIGPKLGTHARTLGGAAHRRLL